MAQQKRRRRSDEQDGSSDSESSDSATTGRGQSKRTRLSMTASTPHDRANGNYDNADDMSGVYTYQYTAPTNDATFDMEVFGSDDEDEDQIDEVRASEYVRKAMTQVQENMASESGIIEEVSMRNFMCHSRLTIPLGPLINFIIGHNGSGKSAILTAITVCLGAKATATNRAGSLKNFIKEGQDHGWVSVKIKNQGENAYRPDLYGHSIFVERHFTRSGTSSFKVKNSEGRQVSTKRADLEDITDFFALQIDNPMNVLSQDQARQFLSNSTPYDKYKFFIKGTQLEQLDKDYILMEQYLDDTEAKTEARQEDLAILGEKKRKAEEKKKMMDRTETIQTQINETGWMHAWAQIEEQERVVEEFESRIRQRERNIERAQRAADEVTRIFNEEHENHGANLGVIADYEAQLLPKREEHKEIKEKFDENRKHLTESVATQRQIKTDLQRHKGEISKAQAKIDAEHARIENANGPAHARKVADLEQTRAKLSEYNGQAEQHRGSKPQLEHAVQQAEQDARATLPPIEQKQQELRQAEGLLNTLERDKPDQMRAFPQPIHAVVRAIRNETRFRDKPVGPMGFHVHLKKTEWASAVERTCGGQLDSFIVTNKQDQSILSEIMRRNNCHSSILVGSSRHIDVSRNEPEERVDTILRIVDIDNELVRNALIINQRIEQTVLIPSSEEGNLYAQRRKPNVVAVISHHPKRHGSDIRYNVTRGGGNNSSPVQKWEKMYRVKTSAEDQIRLQKTAVQQIRQELEQLQDQRRVKENALNSAKQAVNKHNQEAAKLRLAVQRAEDRVGQLENEISQDNINDSGVLEELHGQLQEAENDLQTAKDSYEDSVVQKDRIDAISKTIKQDLDKALAAVQELEARIKEAQARADERGRTRHNALLKKNHAIGLLEEAERERAEIVERRDNLVEQIENDLIPQAEQVHSRIPVAAGETVDSLDAKIGALLKEKERVQQSIGGSREVITERFHHAAAVFKKAHDDLDKTISDSKRLKTSLVHRKGRWRKFRKLITTRAQILFMYLLSERGFRGRILANHQEKMLDINVEPDITRASDKGRQTKTLSGGEKSFSTICLLLSIWEAMGSPIRCLDEFDVFMDHANRDISMKMMVQAARRSVGRQFILITPQAMTAVEGWHDVKIFKMTDPERGQTTLPFGE